MEIDYKKLYEETKKLYDDTLEKAKEINDEHKDSILGKTIEYLFPQLKDNEDEKMRKWLIGYFEQYKIDGMGDFANGYKVDDIVAWIEKKGEYKEATCVAEIIDRLSEKEQDILFKELELQKEQKPVEWTEKDKVKLFNIKTALYDYYTEGNAEELMDWIKTLPKGKSRFEEGHKVGASAEKYNQWKPTEEQMKALETAVKRFGPSSIIDDPELLETLYNDLKKL